MLTWYRIRYLKGLNQSHVTTLAPASVFHFTKLIILIPIPVVHDFYGLENTMRSFLYGFMMGRYGPDHLGVGLVILSFVLSICYAVFGYLPFLFISYFTFALTLFRMLSRNLKKRRAENDIFIRYWWPVKVRCQKFFKRVKEFFTHKRFKCPKCKTKLRVPRGVGKLRITCTKCDEKIFKKS